MSMRILVISNLYPPHGLGGYEERCKVCVDALRQRGHEVAVLTSSYGHDPEQPQQPEEGVHRELTPVGFLGSPGFAPHNSLISNAATTRRLLGSPRIISPMSSMSGTWAALVKTFCISPTA